MADDTTGVPDDELSAGGEDGGLERMRAFVARMKAVPFDQQVHVAGPSRFSDPMALPCPADGVAAGGGDGAEGGSGSSEGGGPHDGRRPDGPA